MKKTAMILAIVVATLISLVGCSSEPVYRQVVRTRANLTLPDAPDGKTCAMQCENIRLQCQNMCQMQSSNCKMMAQSNAQAQYTQAMNSYQQEEAQRRASCRQCMQGAGPYDASNPKAWNCVQFCNDRDAPRLKDFLADESSCNADCGCQNQYYSCYQTCGGKVDFKNETQTICVKNC